MHHSGLAYTGCKSDFLFVLHSHSCGHYSKYYNLIYLYDRNWHTSNDNYTFQYLGERGKLLNIQLHIKHFVLRVVTDVKNRAVNLLCLVSTDIHPYRLLCSGNGQ